MKKEIRYYKNRYIIKNKCAWCGKKIKNNWERFKKFGNCCYNCDLKFLIITQIRGKIVFMNFLKNKKAPKKEIIIIENKIADLKKKLVKKYKTNFNEEIKEIPFEFIEKLFKERIKK